MDNRTFAYAVQFARSIYSVIPILPNGTKQPACAWKRYQAGRADLALLREWFDRPRPFGIGLIHGAISGNSEVLDFDHEAIGVEFYMRARLDVPAIAGAPWVQTPRPGYQLFYRLADRPPGNLRIAEHPNPDWTEGAVGIPRWKTVIETRGEGGYTVTIGSPAGCHPTGRCYRLVFGSFRTVPVLTVEQRDTLHTIAASYDQRPPGEERDHRNLDYDHDDHAGELRPGDDFARSVDWSVILERHGWTLSHRCNGTRYWTRPGKSLREGHSASTNYGGLDLLYVFSSSASPFEPERVYSKFAAFALLEHGGDFKAAAKELAGWRYGR